MNFDRVAVVYRWLERIVYGGSLQRARVAHLEPMTGEPRALVLGDGDGRFLAALLERAPGARVDVVEASAKMIALAKRDVPADAAVTFHHVRIEDFEPTDSYDLVVSHFFLDCFDRAGVEAVVERVSSVMKPGSQWLISDFQLPEDGLLKRLRAKILLWAMYRFFRLAAGLETRELVDPAPILEKVGLDLGARTISNLGFVRADRWCLRH